MEALQHAGVPPWLMLAAPGLAGGAKGAFAKAAVRGETKAELKAMRGAELTGKEAEKLKYATSRQPDPALGNGLHDSLRDQEDDRIATQHRKSGGDLQPTPAG